MKKTSPPKRKPSASKPGADPDKSVSRRQWVYQNLVRKIATGELPAGTPIYEAPLSKELGVSRTPVREAIGQLVAEGILDDGAGRGAVVLQSTRQDIVELYEVREALETHAVSTLAARGLLPQEIQAIERSADEMKDIKAQLKKAGKAALEGDALQRFVSCDLRFHMSLLQACGNRRLIRIINNTRLLIRVFTFRREHHTADLITQVHAYHRQILGAVVKRNPAEAARVMREHIRVSLSERLAEYREDWIGMPPEMMEIF